MPDIIETDAEHALLHIKIIRGDDSWRVDDRKLQRGGRADRVETMQFSEMKIVNMRLQISTHRLLFFSTTNHAFLIKG